MVSYATSGRSGRLGLKEEEDDDEDDDDDDLVCSTTASSDAPLFMLERLYEVVTDRMNQ